jgi:hypothetical protein
LSNALKNFVGQSVIPRGASQYYPTDQRRYQKDSFFPVSALSEEPEAQAVTATTKQRSRTTGSASSKPMSRSPTRATLIPLLAVPVSLVGTFVLFPLFGFSVNTLSLFDLVAAIALVVDDAIAVVEGVERHIEKSMTPKAALKAMEELSGPVVGIAYPLRLEVWSPTARPRLRRKRWILARLPHAFISHQRRIPLRLLSTNNHEQFSPEHCRTRVNASEVRSFAAERAISCEMRSKGWVAAGHTSR